MKAQKTSGIHASSNMKTNSIKETDELLNELTSKADQLFKLGIKMRLPEDKIRECAMVSLQRKIKHVLPKRSFCRPSVSCVVTLLVVRILLLAVMGVPVMLQSTFDQYCFDLVRIIRIAMMPLLPTTGADEYISPDCAVSNPLYNKAADCNICADNSNVVFLSGTPNHTFSDSGDRLITGVDILSDGPANAYKQRIFNFESILQHINSSARVSIAELLTAVQDYGSELGTSSVECDPGGSLPVTQLSNSPVNLTETSCVWGSKLDLRVTRVMRGLFRRPSLLPKSTEVALKKTVFIDGPGSGARNIDEGFLDYMNTWYVQSQGERTLEFVPLKECKDICHRVTTRVLAGDNVIFPSKLWSVKVLENGKEPSLGFESYLSL